MLRIAVTPPSALATRRRLFDALASIFPVELVATAAHETPASDAVIAFGGDPGPAQASLTFAEGLVARDEPVRVRPGSPADRRLHGLCLPAFVHEARSVGRADADVAAETAAGRPVWARFGDRAWWTTAELPELREGETLRDRFSRGGWLGGVALFQFLRERTSTLLPAPPPTRATIVVDDPNLRWFSYGRLDYRRALAHAAAEDFHLAIAAVPLDLRLSHRGVVELFRRHRDRLSLAVHGNNHTRRELADTTRAEDQALRALAQAWRRVAAFEQRTGLQVARVVAPPHEACGRQAMKAIVALGFEAATLSRAFSWVPARSVSSPWSDPDAPLRVTGFSPAEVLPMGLPVIVRRDFASVHDAPLFAFLDQPIVLYGHEGDFDGDLAVVDAAAATVNGVGAVRWTDLGTIASTNFSVRRHGTSLEVRSYGRRIELDVPENVGEIVLEPLVGEDSEMERCVATGTSHVEVGQSVRTRLLLTAGPERTLTIDFTTDAAVSAETVPPPAPALRAVARRIATEARDRARAGR
jgi:hypothetical protein